MTLLKHADLKTGYENHNLTIFQGYQSDEYYVRYNIYRGSSCNGIINKPFKRLADAIKVFNKIMEEKGLISN